MQQQKQNVSSEPYGTGKSEEDDINEDSFASMAFYILVGIAEAIGLISIAMVVIWMKHYRGGFAWDGSGKEFNYHPVFMVLALVFLNGNGALMYRLFRNQEKFVVKLVHMTIQSVAVIYTVLGVMAVFDFHNKSKIPNAYSLHSWLGLGAVCLFCCQYLFGFLSFLWPKLPDDNRAQYLNVHQFFGSAIFVLAIGACLTGITEKLLFSIPHTYSKFPSEGLIANSVGILLVLFAALVIHLVSHPSYKRSSLGGYIPLQ